MNVSDLRNGAVFVTTAAVPARLGIALCRDLGLGGRSAGVTLPKGLRLEAVAGDTTRWGGQVIMAHDPMFKVVTAGHEWAGGQVFIKQAFLQKLASAKAEAPPRARKRAVAARRARP